MQNDLREIYWDGKKNKFIRYYYYARKGLELLNEFRYLVMAVLGFYFALRMDSPILIPLMFLLSIPALIFFGWLSVHHISKVCEWLNIQFSTHWSRYTYDLQEEMIKHLKEIKDEIKRSNN